MFTFEQIARNPDKFKGTNVKIIGEVVQVLYGSNSVDLRVNITKKVHIRHIIQIQFMLHIILNLMKIKY